MSATRLVPIDNWCIEYQWATQAWEQLELADASAFGFGDDGASGEMQYAVDGGVAILTIDGPLTKEQYCGGMFGGTSTVLARRALQKATRDSKVSSILLKISSPGGQVSGTNELASEIAKVRKSNKPIIAYCEDQCCSAAYWFTSQCDQVYCNPTATIGSIGTYMVMYDMSKAYEARGVKVHVIGSGDMKGAGEAGTQITAKMLERWRENILDINSHFVNAVASGRGLTPENASNLATGEAWIGERAKAVGLVDDVKSYDDVLEDIKFSRLGIKKGSQMANETSVIDRIKAVLNSDGNTTASDGSTSSDRELLSELRAMNITSIAQLGKLSADARIGMQHIADRRSYAKAQAIRAYGPERGAVIGARMEFASLDEVNASSASWEAEADLKFNTANGQSNSRTSKPSIALNAESGTMNEVSADERKQKLLSMTTLGKQVLAKKGR